MTLLLPLMLGCTDPADPARIATDQLFRASILLRSAPPRPDEIEAVQSDPGALRTVVQAWSSADPAFGAVVRDLHAQDLYVRFDTQTKPPSIGPLAGVPGARVAESLDEAPLRLIEHIVVHGRPYTDIVTTEDTLADALVSAAFGPPHDPDGPEWQVSHWPDERPGAGILSSTALWLRHPSGNLNHHRSRATVVANALLCDDVVTRASAGALDPIRQEEAVREDPDCVACHAVLDPIASTFWGFRPYILPTQIQRAYAVGCEGPDGVDCYPLPLWDPGRVNDGVDLGMPEPALYGQRVTDLADLGRAIANDPRFPSCTVRRFWSYLARIPRDDVPHEVVLELAEGFEAGGFDARALLLDIVAHPAFAPTSEAAPAVAIRPQQLVRTIEGITGYTWAARPSSWWGTVSLGTTDRYGFNALMGGLDGWRVVGLEPGALPTRELAMAWLAEEAAIYVVETELARAPDARDLLPQGTPIAEGPARRQLAWLRLRILGQPVGPRSPEVDADWALLRSVLRESGSSTRAWMLVVAALLQHPRLTVL